MLKHYIKSKIQAERALKHLKEMRQVPEGEKGASLVEYAILVALVGLVVIGAVTTFGSTLSGVFTSASTDVGGLGGP